MNNIYISYPISSIGKATISRKILMLPAEKIISVSVKELLEDLYTTLEKSSARLSYKVAGKYDGSYITKGNLSEIIEQCKKNDISYIINGFETSSGVLGRLANDFSNNCFCDTTINAFISTKNSRASPLHYDYHDLVNIQLVGEKKWKIYSVADDVIFPISGYKITSRTTKTTIFDDQIKTGTLFTIPKGAAHTVSTVSDVSIHIAIGLRYKSISDLIIKLISHNFIDRTTPILTILDKLPTEIDKIKKLDFSLSKISEEDVANQLLSLQKILPFSSKQNDKIDRLIFNRGAFYFQTKNDQLNIKLPIIADQEVTIDPVSFRPGLLQLPIVLKNVLEHICQHGEINRETISKEFDEESTSEILDFFYKTGLASNANK